MYLLFDIGGTTTRVAFSKDGKGFENEMTFPTPPDFENGIFAMTQAAEKLGAMRNIKFAGGGLPGVFDIDRSMLLRSPNLPDWIGKPVRERLSMAFGVQTYLENDAALVGLGEAVYGAGKGFPIVEYITVSTGVGGARIVDGKLDERAVGFEPGQTLVNMKSGETTTLEQTISGFAIEARFGKKPKEVTDMALWEELAENLAYGLHNTVVLWSPDVIVLGGSMIVGDPAISVERVGAHLKDLLKIFPNPPILKKAELGNVGGLWGALEFIKNKI